MGELRVNLTNFITVGLMAFVFVYVAKKGFQFFGVNATEA